MRRRCPRRQSSTRAAHQQQAAHPRGGAPLPRAVEGGADLPTTKAVLETRPVYHASDAAIRGHLFTSFLALVLRKELQDRLQAAELDLEWQDVIADLDRVVETTVDQQGRSLRAAQSGARLCRSSDPGRWCRPAAPVPTLATAR